MSFQSVCLCVCGFVWSLGSIFIFISCLQTPILLAQTKRQALACACVKHQLARFDQAMRSLGRERGGEKRKVTLTGVVLAFEEEKKRECCPLSPVQPVYFGYLGVVQTEIILLQIYYECTFFFQQWQCSGARARLTSNQPARRTVRQKKRKTTGENLTVWRKVVNRPSHTHIIVHWIKSNQSPFTGLCRRLDGSPAAACGA